MTALAALAAPHASVVAASESSSSTAADSAALSTGAVLLGLGIMVALIVAGLALVLLRSTRRPASQVLTAGGMPLATLPSPAAGSEAADRLALAVADIAAATGDAVVASHLAWALEQSGFLPVDATGEVFDPQRHRAVGRREVSDPRLHNRVAATPRAGLRTGTRLLRLPEVDVYRHPESRS